jgi:hypothetical protein
MYLVVDLYEFPCDLCAFFVSSVLEIFLKHKELKDFHKVHEEFAPIASAFFFKFTHNSYLRLNYLFVNWIPVPRG